MIRKLIEESGGNEYVQLKERKYVEVDDVWELWQACRESGMKVKEFLAYCDVRVGEMKREGKLPEGFEVKYRTVKYIWLDPTRLIDDVR
ncbi:hypothetical protein [Candidatus Methylacidithermus pantelleriae]|nr:hypothetical protein [Candidatus Methylacidithermus pantelleriae]